MNRAFIVLIVWIVSGSAACAREQPTAQRNTPPRTTSKIHKLEELTWPEIDALDRARTVFILPVGMLEEHGPHLPIGADTIGVAYEANETAMRVSRALPDWRIVIIPALNYGHAGANVLGDRPIHPGTYAIRQATLRSVVADLGSQVARNGFKWIFVMSGHAAPTHNSALDEACDFVSERYGATMLHVTALFRADAAIQSKGEKMSGEYFSENALSSFGMDIHAGVGETSGMLAVRPDLVRSNYKTLPNRAGRSPDELRQVALARDWEGYFSSPAQATAAYGRAVEEWWISGLTELILRAVRGENLFAHARAPQTIPPPVAPILEKVLADDAAFEAELEKWLMERGKRPVRAPQ
jgi:creatinine amidohydrolase